MEFARYTEHAKRVVFFGRYEASQYGSREIGTEHLLLGLFRGDRALARKLLGSGSLIWQYASSRKSIESIRHDVRIVGPKLSTSEDIPLSNESKRVLKCAAEEADQFNDQHIRSEHLVLALLRQDGSVAARLLNKEGVTLEAARKKLGR